MRILLMSDLHMEVWREAPADAQHLASPLLKNLNSSSPDAVVLEGDIDLGDHAVAWAQTAFPDIPAVYVHGNHEAYGDKLEKVKERIAIACAATDQVHLLDRSVGAIGGVRFLGAIRFSCQMGPGQRRTLGSTPRCSSKSSSAVLMT